MSIKSDEVRKNFKASDDVRDAGLTTPENIQRYDDILYGNDPKNQILDVYRPKNKQGEKLPVLVNVHGGGWVYGDKERYQYYCMNLAQHGFAVVNFTYRLAPESKFPAPLEDLNQVVYWILKNDTKYDFDSQNIFAVGDSAGGNDLNIYNVICTNPEYANKFNFHTPAGFQFNAVLLNCGAYRIKVKDAELESTPALMADYLPNGGDEVELDMMNALPYITKNYPPAFILTANRDFLKEDAITMANKLQDLGVPHVFKIYGDKENPLYHVFQCNIKLDIAQQCNKEQCDFLKTYIKY